MAALKSFVTRFVAGSGSHQLGIHAAALAYYAVFSIFPLSLLIVSGLGFFLPDAVFETTLTTLISFFPRLAQLLTAQVERIQAARNAFGVIGLVGLLYGASGYFSNLSAVIHQVFDAGLSRPFWLNRGLGMLLVTLVAGLLLVAVFLTFLIGSLVRLPIVPAIIADLLGTRTSSMIVFVAGGLGILLLFRFMPSRRPPWRLALAGALLTMVAVTVLSMGFNWYLNSPLARFNVIYGSIGTVMALILFLNLANLVIVHGALFTALLSQSAYPPLEKPLSPPDR